MLVFFLHGVATRDVKYGDKLKGFITEEFTKRGEFLPQFYYSFWGDVLNDVGRMWNWIHQDLQEVKKEFPNLDIQTILRYQQFRQGFLSEFVGDAFTYLNQERGVKIRELIADQLEDFIRRNPEETDLHIVAHSLGSVILWDSLFSDRFDSDDAAFHIRSMIKGLGDSTSKRQVCLRSITTMGSPILFFNTMLDINPNRVKSFAKSYKNQCLRWINIIHSSDIIAYPIRTSFNIDSSDNIFLQDEYIFNHANLAENTAYTVGQVDAALALGVVDAHHWYMNCSKTANLITNNILAGKNIMYDVISRLKKLPDVKNVLTPLNYIFDKKLVHLNFRDGSGSIQMYVNFANIHHVYIFDTNEDRKFAGYFGWNYANSFQEEIELIKREFC